MPFVSEAQRRYLWANEPDVAGDWAHEHPGQKNLPYHKGDKKPEIVTAAKHKESADMNTLIADLAMVAAERPYVVKLAEDAGLQPDDVRYLAAVTGLSPVTFCKQAYDDPAAFNELVRLMNSGGLEKLAAVSPMYDAAMGVTPGLDMQSLAIPAGRGGPALPGTTPSGLLSKLRGAGGRAVGGISSGIGTLARLAGRHPYISGLGALGLGAGAGGLMLGGGNKPDTAGPTAVPDRGGVRSGGPGPSLLRPGPGLASVGSVRGGDLAGAAAGVAKPNPVAAATGDGGGMHPALKAALIAAGVGTGAYGLSRLFRRKKDKEGSDKRGNDNVVIRIMRRAANIKLAEMREKEARDQFTSYLDVVASKIGPVEKRAAVRTVQAEVSRGRPLSVAIKKAYAHLSGEERGMLAARLCQAAAAYHYKRANAATTAPMSPQGGLNTVTPISATGPANTSGSLMQRVGP